MSSFQVRPADNDVRGRLALVTGASGGIGSACARALAKEGCNKPAEDLASELHTLYPSQKFTTHQADLSSRSSTLTLVPSVLTSHPSSPAISILVANAGLGRRIREIRDIKEEDWDEVFEVNARSQFVVVKGVEEGMRMQKWGRVVLVGSIAARGGGINGCHYAATKGALTSMGLNLATVLAPHNITVNIVSPAMIGSTGMIAAPRNTTLVSDAPPAAEEIEDLGLKIAATVPLGRLGEPEEVANVVTMFVKTGYMTGQDIVLGGGLK